MFWKHWWSVSIAQPTHNFKQKPAKPFFNMEFVMATRLEFFFAVWENLPSQAHKLNVQSLIFPIMKSLWDIVAFSKKGFLSTLQR